MAPGYEARIQKLRDKALAVLKPTRGQLEHGLELHRRFLVCDSFGFLPSIWTQELFDRLNQMRINGDSAENWRNFATTFRMYAMTRDQTGAEEFVAALRASGVKCLVLNVGNAGAAETSLPIMAAYSHVCRVFNRYLVQAGSPDQIQQATKDGRTAIVWSVNGSPGYNDRPDEMFRWLETWHQLGVRFMHLAYNRRNAIAGGCTETRDEGLSDFGREYIKRMNEAGIAADLSHSSCQAVLDTAKISSRPIVATHTGVRSLFDHPRCRSDAELKAIADTDGLAGIYLIPFLLGPKANISTVLNHLDAAVKIAGIDHVAIGTDICYAPGVWPPPNLSVPEAFKANQSKSTQAAGWKPEHHKYHTNEHIEGSLAWTNWPLLTVGMVMRGYSDGKIEKILGLNLMRVLNACRPESEVENTGIKK